MGNFVTPKKVGRAVRLAARPSHLHGNQRGTTLLGFKLSLAAPITIAGTVELGSIRRLADFYLSAVDFFFLRGIRGLIPIFPLSKASATELNISGFLGVGFSSCSLRNSNFSHMRIFGLFPEWPDTPCLWLPMPPRPV